MTFRVIVGRDPGGKERRRLDNFRSESQHQFPERVDSK